jgi:two-component system sensor histidine kinase QseC
MRSIRGLLLWGTFITLIVVLGGSGWLGFKAGRDEAEELFDARLATSARVLDILVARQIEIATVDDPIVIDIPSPLKDPLADPDESTPLGHYYETSIAFQVWNGGESATRPKLVARSASAPIEPFAPLQPGWSDRTLDGRIWRVFVLATGHSWVAVAERDDARSELTQKLAFAATTPLLVGGPVLLALLSLLIRYGLAPLSELARRLETRKPDALLPLQLERAPDEVIPVVAALNGLLGRTREAFERERRFIDAAAHELRTPLAALKIHAQNAAAAQDEQSRRTSMARMLDGLDRTTHLASQMLAYSRITGPVAKPAEQQLSLRTIVGEALDQMRHAAGTKDQQIIFDGGEEGDAYALRGDPAQLASMVRNLVDNASQYSPPGSAIRVRLSRGLDRSIHFEVIDSGPGIPPELRERVFESYFRIPGSAGSGSGLGLAIVREIAHRHGGRVGIDSPEQGGGTRVHMIFDGAGLQSGALKTEADPADKSL